MNKKKIIRRSLTAFILLLVLGIVLYPKLRPLSNSDSESIPGTAVKAPGMRGNSQPLLANEYIINPTQMNELIYSTGSLIPKVKAATPEYLLKSLCHIRFVVRMYN